MVIEFLCPQCSAAIRVADSAAGKKGTCPSCRVKLRVPQVDRRESSMPSPEPSMESPDSRDESPETQGEPEASASGSPQVETGGSPSESQPFAFESAETTRPTRRRRSARRGKRRRRRSKAAVPIVFGGILVAAVAWFFYEEAPKLEGELQASRLQETQQPPGMVSAESLELPEAVTNTVLQDLEENPQRLRSDLMVVELRGKPGRLEVGLEAGSAARFVRVDVRSDPALRDYLVEHVRQMNARRRERLLRAARRFFRDWYQAIRQDMPVDNLVEYRESLGLNALLGGLGFCVEAIVGRESYRCVYEDSEGRLYFLLPRGAKQFELQGRELPDGSILFPGHYTVRIAEPKPEAKSLRVED